MHCPAATPFRGAHTGGSFRNFVRSKSTLQSAANTKLDRDSAAYKALVKKRSYTGPATVLGGDYQASYAPLIGEDGQLTGALFVGVPK